MIERHISIDLLRKMMMMKGMKSDMSITNIEWYAQSLITTPLPDASNISNIIKAFSRPLEWRTGGGISRTTGFSIKSIEKLITENASSFVTSSLSPAGFKLYSMTPKAWHELMEKKFVAEENEEKEGEARKNEEQKLKKKQEGALTKLAMLKDKQGSEAVSQKVKIIKFLLDSKCKMPSMSNIYLVGADLKNLDLDVMDFEGANLAGSNMSGANLTDTYLKGANLEGVVLENAKLTGAVLSEANLSNCKLTDSNLDRAILTNANLNGSNFKNVSLYNCILKSTDLSKSHGITMFQLMMADIDGTTIPPKNVPDY